jgi:hypothetical protein
MHDDVLKYRTLEKRKKALGITKDTHPTEVAWLYKNGDLVPWDRVETLDQLREFVEQRVAQRMELGQYELTAEGTILAEQSEMRALSIRASKGDLEALRAIELHEKGGWEMVIKEHYNPKRKSNLDLWKRYLTEENLEFAKDPFWQDLVWDIPVSSWRKKGTFGMGETVELKPGVLDKLRDDVEFESINLPKAYRELMQELADSSEEDLPRKGNNKTWIYIPSRDEGPKKLDANVEKLKKWERNLHRDKSFNAELLLRYGSYWLLQDKRKIKVCIYLQGKEVKWFKDGNGGSEIHDEYIEDVLNHLRENKLNGEELLIAEYGKDPNKQIELAQGGEGQILRLLAKNKNLDPRAQRILFEEGYWLVRELLAKNPIITPEIQMSLAETENVTIITQLAKNRGLISQVQYYIAENGTPIAKENLAGNPSILPDVQIKLAKSEIHVFHRALARNPSIVPQAEKILINTEAPWLMSELAANESISEQAQLALIEEGVKIWDMDALKPLADRKNLCPLAEIALAKSPYPEVRELLRQRLNISKEARKILDPTGCSLQQSKQDAMQAKGQGQTQSQGIAK